MLREFIKYRGIEMRTLFCVLAIGLIACAGVYADLADGLVGYWSFDEGTGKDDSGNGNEGAIVGNPQMVAGKAGNALDFNGDDGVEIAHSASLTLPDELTAACWIFPRAVVDGAGNDHAGVVWKGNMIGWGADVYNFRIATASAQGLTWGSTGGGVEGYFATANCFTDGLEQWYHVALVEDGSEGRAYVNGAVLTDADVTGGDMHRPAAPYDVWESEPVRIGWSQGRGGDLATLVYFDGIIDEVAIYNRALSADEVGELMSQGLSTTAVEPGDKLVTTWSRIKAR
jgi:MSHA biogenesis protein MshQ